MSREGQAACAHFKIRYPIPLGPGAEESAAVFRAAETSSGFMGVQVHVGKLGGSSSCMVSTCCGFWGKNRFLEYLRLVRQIVDEGSVIVT